MRLSGFPARSRIAGPTLLILACAASSALADAPKVVRSSPDDGEMGVDPSTRELRVTFDQDMNQRGFSFVGGGPTFPGHPSSRPRWVDARTVVLPLRLEPGREYQTSINNERFRNFRNARGEPAVPYPIRFKTGTGDGKDAPRDLTELENRRAVDRLRKAVDEDYSYRDLRDVDWDGQFREATGGLLAARTPLEFAKRAAVVLGPAKDPHLWLKVGGWEVPTFERSVSANFGLDAVVRAVPGLKRDGPVAVGRFQDGITYVLIASWSPEVESRLGTVDRAIDQADPTKGLILDVRPNGGGAEPLARGVAGCFLDAPKVYARNVTRQGGKSSTILERSVGPSPGRPAYRGRVMVLTGPAVMSSCESFLLMMKQVPGCTLVGARSYGSSGNPRPVDLGNGVTALVPSWKNLRPDGTCFEGEGIEPDVKVDVGPEALAAGDPVLEAALAILREK